MKAARSPFLALVTLLGLLAAMRGHAVRLTEPYAVEMPVASQAAAERQAAQAVALSLVLERLSGQRLDDQPLVKAALPKAESYLQQFAYLQPPAVAAGTPVTPGWRLQLVFSPAAVNALLDQAGVPLWPLDRPRVMLLVANEKAQLLPAPASLAGDAPVALQQLGQQRGLPLLLLDPAAQDLTVAAAVQALDAAALQPLLAEQKADVMLLGSVTGNDQVGWRGEWLLQVAGTESRFPLKAATFAGLADAALREAAARLAAHYRQGATADTGPAALRLQVDGIRSYAAFSQLRQQLEKTEAVQRIDNTQISGTTVIIDLQVKGRESFRQLVALYRPLQWREEIPVPPGSDPAVRPVWRYQWSE